MNSHQRIDKFIVLILLFKNERRSTVPLACESFIVNDKATFCVFELDFISILAKFIFSGILLFRVPVQQYFVFITFFFYKIKLEI